MSDWFVKIGAMENYTYRADYSPEYGEYLGKCLEFPRELSRAPTARQAIEDIEKVVRDVVDEMVADEETLPASLTDRQYSGNFMVRTSPALHGRLIVEANEQGVSMNHLVVQKLAGRNPAASLDPWF